MWGLTCVGECFVEIEQIEGRYLTWDSILFNVTEDCLVTGFKEVKKNSLMLQKSRFKKPKVGTALLLVSSGTRAPIFLLPILVHIFYYQVNSWFQSAVEAPAIKPMFYKC